METFLSLTYDAIGRTCDRALNCTATPPSRITVPASHTNSRVKRLFSTPSDQSIETPTFPTVQLFPISHGTVCRKEDLSVDKITPQKTQQQKVIICGLLGYNRDRFMG